MAGAFSATKENSTRSVGAFRIGGPTDEELANAFFEEWRSLEDFRVGIIKRLIGICRDMHSIREELTQDMVQVLVEDKWREGVVTKHLADGCLGFLRAIQELDKPKRVGDFAERVIDPCSWGG